MGFTCAVHRLHEIHFPSSYFLSLNTKTPKSLSIFIFFTRIKKLHLQDEIETKRDCVYVCIILQLRLQ